MFIKDKYRGKWGEAQFASLLDKSGIQYEDVSENKEWQKVDVDFLINGIPYEVKTDFAIHNTRNIFIEVSKETKTGVHPGWWQITKAKVIAWIDAINGIIYMIDVNKLKLWMVHNAPSKTFNIDTNCKTTAILYPVWQLKEQGIIYAEYFCEKY